MAVVPEEGAIFEPLSTSREYSPNEMRRRAAEFYDDHRRRRTVRHFAPRAVPREVIEHAILAAGTAPSGANMQPWRFVAIADAAVKRRIRAAAEEEERAFYHGRASAEWLAALAPLGRPANERPYLLVVAGYPADGAAVPVAGGRKKTLGEIATFV